MNTTLKIILWIVVLALVAYGVYYFFFKNKTVLIPGNFSDIDPLVGPSDLIRVA